MDKANKLLLKLLKQKEKRDASGYKRVNTKQNKKQRKLRVEQFLPKVRPITKLQEQLEGVKRKRIMDLDYKKKLAELKTQRERQIESIATPSVETLIKQEKRKAGRPKKVIDISALKQVKELYEMNVSELKEEARKEGIKTSQTKTSLIKQLQEQAKSKEKETKQEKKEAEELYRAELFKEPTAVMKKKKQTIESIESISIRQEKKSLDKMTKQELQEEAQYYRLAKTGNKGDIINRLNKHLEGARKEGAREPTEAEREDAIKKAKLFDELRYKVNPVASPIASFLKEELALGNQEIAQDKATNDVYEAQKKAEEANFVLPEKLVEDAKQNALMNATNKNDEQAVDDAVKKQAKKRAPKQSNKTGTI